MKFLFNKDRSTNTEDVLIELIKILQLKISAKTIRNTVSYHPAYPSLATLSDSLDEWDVENLCVNLNAEQLNEIPLPAIAHMQNTTDQYFVVVKQIDSDQITYEDPSLGTVRESIVDFCKRWTSYMLIVSAKPNSGERDFILHQRQERLDLVNQVLKLTLPIILIGLTFFNVTPGHNVFVWLPLMLLSIGGAFISWALVKIQFGEISGIAQQICGFAKGSSCDGVLKSPAAKIFGIGMSEIGLIFFSGNILSLMLSSFVRDFAYVLPFYLILFTGAVGYSFFSVTYQKFVIKQWCPLCLITMGIFYLQLIVVGIPFLKIIEWHLSINAFLTWFAGFVISMWLWAFYRENFLSKKQLTSLKKFNTRFKQSPVVIEALLNNSTEVISKQLQHEITWGNPNASFIITMVTNPTCGPCKFAHANLKQLLTRYEDQVKVIFRLVSDTKEKSISTVVSKHLLGLAKIDNSAAYVALTDWFGGTHRNVDSWKDANKISYDPSPSSTLFNDHIQWAHDAGINSTPTLLINNKRVPQDILISDLAFYLKAQLA